MCQGVCEATGPNKHETSSWNMISLQVSGGMLKAGGVDLYLKRAILLSRMHNLHDFFVLKFFVA